MTSQPANESELQLYRVLQRANLLSYYDTFICQGGDDVQQLCEAGEEEFLEIMALVGMASKPLHVRRLQKALQEWVTNPAMFQSPIVPTFPITGGPGLPPPSSHALLNQLAVAMASRPSPMALSASQASPVAMRTSPTITATVTQSCNSTHSTPSPNSATKEQYITSSLQSQNQLSQYMNQASSTMMCTEYSQPSSPITLTPVLVESQIQRLSEVAELLVKNLPPMDPKPQLGNNKKRISKELEYVMNMPEDDPRRMDEIRKYAAIYGRFDCKRKPEKPLTLHEVSVNEAAAQICKHIPALLSRRDELFPLARQVVRDSGYQYSKGHSRSQSCAKIYDESDPSACKRSRTESSPNSIHDSKHNYTDEDRKRKQERLEAIVDQLKSLSAQHEDIKSQLQQANDIKNFQKVNQLQNELDLISTQQMQLINEQCEINKHMRRYERMLANRTYGRFECDKIDTDDTDSQYSLYSNESSRSVTQDSQQNSPNQDSAHNSSDGFSKLLPTKKTGNSVAANHITKQLVQETLMDEGLRVVKELADQIKDDGSGVDLRVFNKLSDSPRTSNSSSCTVSSSSPALDQSVRQLFKMDTPRPRGRPPKQIDYGGVQQLFHNQMLTQSHINHNQLQHQLLSNFVSSHIQHNLIQSSLQFNTNGFNNGSASNSVTDEEISEVNDTTNGHFIQSDPQKTGICPKDLSKHNNNSIHINGSKDSTQTHSPNSLNALISMNGNGLSSPSDILKQEMLELSANLI